MGAIQPNFSPLAIWANTSKAYDDLGLKGKVVSLNG